MSVKVMISDDTERRLNRIAGEIVMLIRNLAAESLRGNVSLDRLGKYRSTLDAKLRDVYEKGYNEGKSTRD